VRSDARDDAFVNSLVGEGSRFRGDLEINGLLRIDGDFIGNVKTRGKVFIGRNGRVDSTLSAASVVIGGVFKGTIEANEKVIVLASAVVLGTIVSPRVIVEEGVVLEGYLSVGTEAAIQINTSARQIEPSVRFGPFSFNRPARPEKKDKQTVSH
jgi:cytoskeletal protein CcmA (bactofilin family)